MSAPTIEKLRQMKDEDLIKEHDKLTQFTNLTVSYYLEELSRRSNDRRTKTMLHYTWWIALMTIIMTVATLVNLYVAFKLLH